MKITNEQIERGEIDQMAEAIGNCLELNREFIKQHCGETVSALLLQLPEKEREFAIQGCIGEGYFPGCLYGEMPDAIVLPHGEIEFQFEGNAEEVFETPEELTIHGDLAYLYTGYGLILPVDCKKLAANVAGILLPVS
jgi:hypothetical protein